jgi:hypothetical protein
MHVADNEIATVFDDGPVLSAGSKRVVVQAVRHILGAVAKWTYPALVDRVTLTDSGFADHLLSNSSGDRYPRAECRLLRL